MALTRGLLCTSTNLLEVSLDTEAFWCFVLLGTFACIFFLADIGALDGLDDEGAVEDDENDMVPIIDLDMPLPPLGADVFLALPLSVDEYFSGAYFF